MTIKVLSATGGGIRGLAHIGAIEAGMEAEKIPTMMPGTKASSEFIIGDEFNHYAVDTRGIDAFCGDSSAGLIMALVANEWTIGEIKDLLIDTNFKNLFTHPLSVWRYTPWSTRLLATGVSNIKLDRFAKWIDRLGLDPAKAEKLFVNTWDGYNNRHVIYCEKKPAWVTEQLAKDVHDTQWVEGAFSTLGFGTVLTRGMALPGLEADMPLFEDGGIVGHPPLFFIPRDADLTVIDLGYAGLVERKHKKSLLTSAMESYEVTAKTALMLRLGQFSNHKVIRPRVYDVSSTDFALTSEQKTRLILDSYLKTKPQW
jgi:hypothetical protein